MVSAGASTSKFPLLQIIHINHQVKARATEPGPRRRSFPDFDPEALEADRYLRATYPSSVLFTREPHDPDGNIKAAAACIVIVYLSG
ncbi:hypothetical protein V493_05495 [Pseudogymnoascus sp. VKM F-4281 (FW-2241)]|nr:hypothetical protein V493_05495 [Pseudogymnoascus sp. VKM F-4281 (FW-2241)]